MNNERFETYSFLPPLTRQQLEDHVAYLFAHKLVPVIEHIEAPSSRTSYWNLWHMPANLELTPQTLLAQLDQCQRMLPYTHIRLSGYDRAQRTCQLCFIVYTPPQG